MNYFVADTHFGHANVIRLCDRPFPDVEAMDAALIAAWNARVTAGDTVYIVGDLFFRSGDPEGVLRQLKGRKRLIVGNHDGSWMDRVTLSEHFASVDTLLEISDGKHALVLCHYPLVAWKHPKRSYMVHGHIHNDTTGDFWPLLVARDRALNAGVDINGFCPVTFEELLLHNEAFKRAHPERTAATCAWQKGFVCDRVEVDEES